MWCDKHQLEYEPLGINMPGGIVITLGCPECARERDKELDQEEQAREAISTDEAMRSANIEPEYYDATLDTYQADTPEQVKAVQTVKRLIAGEIQQIVMTGSNGTGKTHLAIAAVKELNGKIYTMYEITTRIRQSYSPRADETELEIVDELARLPMLAIDEVGRTKGSDAELNWLSYIIDKRHT